MLLLQCEANIVIQLYFTSYLENVFPGSIFTHSKYLHIFTINIYTQIVE